MRSSVGVRNSLSFLSYRRSHVYLFPIRALHASETRGAASSYLISSGYVRIEQAALGEPVACNARCAPCELTPCVYSE
jgi:hypothetical protein